MPVLTTSPYSTAEQVLEAARIMANDMQMSVDGDILADTQPYIFPMLQLCYEKLYKRLVRAGVNTYNRTLVVPGLLPVANPAGIADPTLQVQLLYTGYYDGVTMHANPRLPDDLIMPLEIWERQSLTNTRWRAMGQVSDSITTSFQTFWFGEWDWEEDQLWFPGATQTNDIKVRYIARPPRLTGPDSFVMINDCKVALAALVGEMASKSRGGLEASAIFKQEADNEIQLLIAPTARKEQYASYVRRAFRGRSRGRGWSR